MAGNKKIEKKLPSGAPQKIDFPADLVKAYEDRKLAKRKKRKLVLFSVSVASFVLLVVLGISSAILFPKVSSTKIAVGKVIKQQQIVDGQEVKWTMLVAKTS